MKILFFFTLLSLASCTRYAAVTTVQTHTISRIDTIGHNIYLHITPAGTERPAYGQPFKVGDTIPVLTKRKLK